MATTGVVEDGEREPGLEHVVGHLGRMERSLPRVRTLLGRPEAVRRPLAALLVLALRGERLGSRDEGQVDVAPEDRLTLL